MLLSLQSGVGKDPPPALYRHSRLNPELASQITYFTALMFNLYHAHYTQISAEIFNLMLTAYY